jgi:hypothetical protein
MTITVVNKLKVPKHIYCGRGSALGNPFVMMHEHYRDKVCDDYEDWFYKNVDEPNFIDLYMHSQNGADYTARPMTAQTRMLLDIFKQALQGDVNLGCFCAPKRCHCDAVKFFLDNKLGELDK